MNTFSFSISDDSMEKIILKHLVVEGNISEKEVPLFKGLERRGRNTFARFETYAKNRNRRDDDLQPVRKSPGVEKKNQGLES